MHEYIEFDAYFEKRFAPMIERVETLGRRFEVRHRRIRCTIILVGLAIPITIAAQVALPPALHVYWALITLLLSTIALGCYQWDDEHQYGQRAQVLTHLAHSLRQQETHFRARTGSYKTRDLRMRLRRFVEASERLIEVVATAQMFPDLMNIQQTSYRWHCHLHQAS